MHVSDPTHPPRGGGGPLPGWPNALRAAGDGLHHGARSAEERVGRRVAWEKPEPRDRPWPLVPGCAGVLVVLALGVVGAVVTVRWLAGVV